MCIYGKVILANVCPQAAALAIRWQAADIAQLSMVQGQGILVQL